MIKFLHLLCMLIFVAGFIFSFIPRSIKPTSHKQLQWETGGLIGFLILSVALGVILVHQKGYFFTTPWIQAALVSSFLVFALLLGIFYLRRKALLIGGMPHYDVIRLWLLRGLVVMIIAAIIHDAATKTTGLL